MNYSSEILHALENVPGHIAGKVLMDIDKRITDWMASGGKEGDPYIKQQLRYAQNIGKQFGGHKKDDN